MNKFIKNILLLVVVLALSYFTADYFGSWYDKFSPQYGGSWFNFPKSIAVFIAGIPLAYVFFVAFTFTLFGFGNRKKWLIWLLIPPLLLWISADRYYIYLPTILALIAFGLAILLRKIFKISQ
ncbi:MAG: hypothetical protein UT20_C0044G0005 [Candidatus Levybacteria bacterium GW2011_GWA1_39_11]|nr:MAG: hypothetical protein UT20_C0044G0005 [Candidatus Levybacteria bacterium GW2011_GWA1_39_11]KKT96101.1 MAG: hypothetical protein UW97_C0018G0005 [Parcubacteria group bacterium GW2011_GWA2_45_15]